jgi:hypothetical protein
MVGFKRRKVECSWHRGRERTMEDGEKVREDANGAKRYNRSSLSHNEKGRIVMEGRSAESANNAGSMKGIVA